MRRDTEDTNMSRLQPLAALRRWLRYRANLKVLSRLDDRMLRDIGLDRCGIRYAARESARD
jgi:uncharacterized protein YjiS (DUF1127 family)